MRRIYPIRQPPLSVARFGLANWGAYGATPHTWPVLPVPDAGDTIVVLLGADNVGATEIALTDSAAHVYTNDFTHYSNVWFRSEALTTRPVSFIGSETAAYSGNVGWYARVAQIKGQLATSPLGETAFATGFSETATINFTTETDHELAVMFINITANRVPAFSFSGGGLVPWKLMESAGNVLAYVNDLGRSGAKTITATWAGQGNASWSISVVTYRAAEFSVGPTSPNITSVVPSSFGPTQTNIVITGTNFGAVQGTSTLDIGGAIQTGLTWSDTEITIPTVNLTGVPNGTVNVRVDVN